MNIRIMFIAFLCVKCNASLFYASPFATAGSGSMNDPWPLRNALTNNTTVQSGDTLLLREGVYSGWGLLCTLQGVTVKNYLNERVIIQDGQTGVLVGSITGGAGISTTNVIKFSETWRVGNTISIGWEVFTLSETRGSPTNWVMNRGFPTNSAHANGDVVYPFNVAILYQSGTNCIFRDFEITSPFTTNRVFTYAFAPSSGLDLHGKGNKAINLSIYNTGHPGIGFWSQGNGGEINGCQFWGIGQYDYTSGFTGTPRGTAIYSQNGGGIGVAQIKNCVFHHVLTDGAEVFGETGPVQDFIFNGNISCANGTSVSLEIASGSTATTNTWMTNNFLLGSPTLSYVSLSNVAEFFSGNVVVNGGLALKETTSSVVTNNDIFMTKGVGLGGCPIQYITTVFSSNNLALNWDYNRYYIGDGSSIYQWSFTSTEGPTANCLGGGVLAFSEFACAKGWKAWTGFDVHSTCITNWPNNYLNVRSIALNYNTNRHRICVVSTSGATTFQIDLSTNNIAVGSRIQVRDIQNYFKVIIDTNYQGGLFTLPLNLTDISPLSGSVTNFTPAHTDLVNDAGFNVFDIDNLGTPQAVIANGTIVNAHF